MKAELREARMEAEPLEKSGGLLRPGVPVNAKYGFIRSEEGNHPVRPRVPVGESIQIRLSPS